MLGERPKTAEELNAELYEKVSTEFEEYKNNLLRRLRKQPPYLVQFVVPGVEGVLDILNDPIVTHSRTSSYGRQPPVIRLRISFAKTARKRQKTVRSL